MDIRAQKPIKYRRIFLLGLVLKGAYYKLLNKDTEMMTVMASGFLRLGGVYVKFLQGVLLQLPVLKLWKDKQRFDVYENVPVDKIDIHKVLQANLRKDQLKRIKSVSVKPFASGSFGQVYHAYLDTGEQVIIKVLRPNTRKFLKRDLRLIKLVSKLLSSSFTNWNVDLRTLVREFVKSTLNETDYKKEVESAEKLFDYYKDNPTIVIPKTYKEISNPTIIVQEFINGVSLAQLLKENDLHKINYAEEVLIELGSDLKIQLIQLGVELNKAVLSSGPIYGDPHPGNIRLLAGNRVALLDFGINAEPLNSPNAYYAMFKEFWRAEYENNPDPGSMFLSYIRFYSGKLYESMKVVSEYASQKYNQSIKLDDLIIKVSNNIFTRKVSTDMLKVGLEKIRQGGNAKNISVDNIVNPGNRFQIAVKINDGAILRAMVNYVSLVTEFGYRNVVPEVYNETVRYVQNYMPQLEADVEPTVKLSEAMEIVYAWLEKVARKDTELYKLISNHLHGNNPNSEII